MAATHKDLDEMVNSKLFREDLWFRLNVFPIHVPPLRERKEDIPLLVHHFLKVKALSAEADSLKQMAD
jgi:transcriptional regulator with GAF, ATPase, and Fis domain